MDSGFPIPSLVRRTPVIILGVPVDSFTVAETVEYVFHLLDCHAHDKRPRSVCTLNADSLADTLSWSMKRLRYSEHLNMLRKADMIMADGAPIIRASRLLGPALKEDIAGADLVPRLIREASKKGKSIYFLGDGVAQDAVDRLKDMYPALKIAGWGAPAARTTSRMIRNACPYDDEAADRISASGADILITAIGGPQERAWFQRNRNLIRVPVSISIGRPFDKRDGFGIRKHFRMRLWNSSPADILKIVALIRPSVFFHQYARAVTPHEYLKMCRNEIVAKHGIREGTAFTLLNLPGSVDSDAARRIHAVIPGKPSARLIVDFRVVDFMDSAGLGALLDLIIRWDASAYEISFAGLSKTIRKCLVVNRLHDLVSEREYADAEEALRKP